MKMTKEISFTNGYGVDVTIEPIQYDVALKLINLTEEVAIRIDKAYNRIVKLVAEGHRNPKEDAEFRQYREEQEKLEAEENQLREKYDYWYIGLENLDDTDIEAIKQKYPRRKNG